MPQKKDPCHNDCESVSMDSAVPLKAGSGKFSHRMAEETLRESEEKILLLLNSTAEAIYGLDMDGNCTFCNNTCLRLLGYQHSDELLGKNMHWQVHSKYADGTHFPVEDCRIFQAFQKGEGTHVVDEVLWRSDGKSFPAEYWSYPQIHDGIVIGAVVTFLDITERKKAENYLNQISVRLALAEKAKLAEAALQESEERFRNLYEDSTIGLYRTTPDGAIHLANSVLVKMLGYSSFDDLAARNLEKNGFVPSYPRAHFIEIIEKNGSVKGLESAWERKDGTMVFVRESAKAFRNSVGKTLYYDGTVEDITEYMEMQQKLLSSEKLAVMGRLVADVAHELNNPLAIVIGRTQLMLHRIDEKSLPFKGQLETVLKSAQRCKTILSNLLTYTNTIGKKDVAVNLPDLINEALDAVSYQYDMRSIEVLLNCNLPANAEITCNKVALLSVFVNLFRNARQAMRKTGKLTITVEIKNESQLCIEIQDTGIGISEEQLAKLFQPFISGWKEHEGTGLGLATSLGIIETYGGKMKVESEGEGKGAKFTVLLPYKLKEEKTLQTNNKAEG